MFQLDVAGTVYLSAAVWFRIHQDGIAIKLLLGYKWMKIFNYSVLPNTVFFVLFLFIFWNVKS